MNSLQLAVVLPNIRSAHNVGSIFRTADAVGVDRVFLSGFTPRPLDKFDRPQKEIAKTALGAEKSIVWEYEEDTIELLKKIKKEGYLLVAIEQDTKAIDYRKFNLKKAFTENKNKRMLSYLKKYNVQKVAFVLGNEVEGLSLPERKTCDYIVEIPMHGTKESLNVAVSFGIAVFRILNR